MRIPKIAKIATRKRLGTRLFRQVSNLKQDGWAPGPIALELGAPTWIVETYWRIA